MIKFPEQGKYSILVFDIPINYLKKGDPIIDYYKGPEDFSVRNTKEFMKLSDTFKERIFRYLRKYGLKDESQFDIIYPKTKYYHYMKESWNRLKNFTYVSNKDIPKEFLIDIIS